MAFLPQAPYLLAGNRLFTDLSNLIVIQTRGAGNGGRSGFRNTVNSTATYQVTSGKTFTAYCLRVDTGSAAFGQTSNLNALIYSDTDPGFDGVAPTNEIPYGGTVVTAAINFTVPPNSTRYFDIKFSIPSSKYIGIFYGDNLSVAGNFVCMTLFGYEA